MKSPHQGTQYVLLCHNDIVGLHHVKLVTCEHEQHVKPTMKVNINLQNDAHPAHWYTFHGEGVVCSTQSISFK